MKIRSKATLTLRVMLARRYGFGASPNKPPLCTCGHRGIACHLAAVPKMAQKKTEALILEPPFLWLS